MVRSNENLVLADTFFNLSYSLFGVHSDEDLIKRMALIATIYTIVISIYSIFKVAPYGKHGSSSTDLTSKVLNSITIPARISWMIQECPACIIPLILMFKTQNAQLENFGNLTIVSCFIVHYIHRSFFYTMKIGSGAKRVPLAVTASAFLFCAFNGFLQGHSLINVNPVQSSFIAFIIGISLFVIGMAINIHHDSILLALREDIQGSRRISSTNQIQAEAGYKIPRGSLFYYISAPNYFGEILEWIGFGIASGNYPQIVFSIFSTIFMGSRSLHTHNFYKKRFGNSYPKQRKALIPFVL